MEGILGRDPVQSAADRRSPDTTLQAVWPTLAREDDLALLLNAANSTTFFIYKEGGEPGPQFTNRLFNPLLEDVQNSGKFFDLSIYPERPSLPVLPDGGRAVVYQNRWPNSAVMERYFFDAVVDSRHIEKPTLHSQF